MAQTSSGATTPDNSLLTLDYPQSLSVHAQYAEAQRTVDFLADEGFPVENCMIVGTDLKQVERITGRLTYGKVALAGALSGLWLGLFVGLIFSLFGSGNLIALLLSTALIGLVFGVVWALLGFAMTRGQRDFASVRAVVATKYEVLVEHKHLASGQQLLTKLPGSRPDPFA